MPEIDRFWLKVRNERATAQTLSNFYLFPFSLYKLKYKPQEALNGKCTLKPSHKHIICFLLVFQNWTFVRKKLARALREERRAAL